MKRQILRPYLQQFLSYDAAKVAAREVSEQIGGTCQVVIKYGISWVKEITPDTAHPADETYMVSYTNGQQVLAQVAEANQTPVV